MGKLEEIGARIKEARENAGQSQKALAKSIGRTESSVAKYEKGLVNFPLSILDEIAEALAVDKNWLRSGYTLEERDQAMKDYFADRLSSSTDRLDQRLQESFSVLNTAGQRKVVECAEDLAKIEEYRKVPVTWPTVTPKD